MSCHHVNPVDTVIRTTAGIACLLGMLAPGALMALEIGIESQLLVTASDNADDANRGEEEEGQFGDAQLGIYGEQRGRVVRGAFTGELYTQKRLDDDDDDFSAISQFLGAATVAITPRSFSWFFGDFLGGVRANDARQPIDEVNNERRNVFVTGPEFRYELDAFSRFQAKFLYLDQTQDQENLETLYNAQASWEVDTDVGNTFGVSFSDIYTDNPEQNLEGDFNRLSASAYWLRDRGRYEYEAALGSTRYDTDEESLTGLNARASITNNLSPVASVTFALTRDLRDQTLSTVNTLIDTGTGVQPEADGVFNETSLQLSYSYKTFRRTFDIGAGVTQSDYELLAGANGFGFDADDEDRKLAFVYSSYSAKMTPRLSTGLSLDLEQLTYDNTADEARSIIGSAQLGYQLTRSVEATVEYRLKVSEGEETAAQSSNPGPFDRMENRFRVGLLWAPPSRASKELTIELKSILQ